MIKTVVLTLCCIFLYASASIPDFIKVCKKSDPELSKCIKSSVEHLRETLAKGLPSFDIIPIEPLEVPDFRVTRNINLNVSDFQISGGSNYKIEQLQANVNKYQFTFVLKFDHISFVGKYKIDMKLLNIPLKGEGPLTGTADNLTVPGKLKGRIIKGASRKILQFDPFQLSVISGGKSTLHLDNLFPTNPALQSIARTVVNDNSEVFMAEIFPVLQVEVGNKLAKVANNIMSHFEADSLFPR